MLEEIGSRGSQDLAIRLAGSVDEYTQEDIEWLARQFDISGAILAIPFEGRGNINLHTYQVIAGENEYLLQKVNSAVFTMPDRVMASMMASIKAQAAAVAATPVDAPWVPIELVPTRDAKPYLDLSNDDGWSVWRLMVRIPDSVCYKSLAELPHRAEQLKLAEEVGRGLAIYSDLTASIDPASVKGSLPGYRETGVYYGQFQSVIARNRTLEQAAPYLPQDDIVRSSTQKHFLLDLSDAEFERRLNDAELAPFIDLVVQQEGFAMGLWSALDEGKIRNTLIHGDTKIENFLFCARTGGVKALVDLDTIMAFTWLADWGDMVRSLANVAGEKEEDLSRVVVDQEVYEAVARGFLKQAREVTDEEVEMMVSAVQIITLELGLRFLTDYLRGDTYFRLGPKDPPDLNKTRAMVQLTLYQRLVDFGPKAQTRLKEFRGRSVSFL